MHDWMLYFGKTGFFAGLTALCLLLIVVSYTLGVYNTQQGITVSCAEKGKANINYTSSSMDCKLLTYHGHKFLPGLYMLQKQQEILNRR